MTTDTNHNHQTASDTEAYPLDEFAVEAMADYDRQAQNIEIARNAVLSYFARQHKLTGSWQLAANHKELTRPAESTVSRTSAAAE
jgi:hypothetical protein